MKKIIALALALIMILGLVACGEKPTVTKPPVEDQKPKETQKPVEITENNDNIEEILKNNGYDTNKGYSITPTDENYLPLYLEVNNTVQTIYVNRAGLKNYKDEAEKELNYDNYGGYSKSGSISTGAAMEAVAVNSSQSIDGFSAGAPGDYEGYSLWETGFNTSEYEGVNEAGFSLVKTSPLSTFSADVDTASYTNLRAILRDTLVVPYDDWYLDYGFNESLHDLRIEEMLNYFDYPKLNETDEPFAVEIEIGDTPWNPGTKLMTVTVQAKDVAPENITGSNLVFLVDTSGSMGYANKIGLVKQSLEILMNNLTDEDTISIVTYSGYSTTVIEGANAVKDKDEILEAIMSLQTHGSTNGSGGIETAYKIAEKYKDGHSNSRIIMCSDGDLNVGITSKDGLEKLVEKNRDKGIYLTILGFGLGNYKDSKMEVLADKGNGNYYYIDSLKEGYKVLSEDITSTLLTIADDVKFQIEFNPDYIKGYRKIGYENRNLADEDFNDDTKDAGEVGYGQTVVIVYEIVTTDSNLNIGDVELKYQNNNNTNELKDWATVSIRYKDHGEKTSNLIQYVADGRHYTLLPSDMWKFKTSLIGFGLLVNDSEYVGDLQVQDIIDTLENLDLTSDQEEIISIIRMYDFIKESGKLKD